ncbi:hypothetical protein WMF18_29525 [Sorangium sp. So ce315]|uniref:hypothetical protein n=1 Tax=Sorangium sp. So ce315 TaxID=3133299 RepID=UPI003F61B883
MSRAERARQRVDAARAAGAVAEKAVAVARLQKARDAVEAHEAELRRSSAATRTSYAGAMARTMSTLTRTDEQAIGTLAALRAEIAAVPDELASIERRLLALAPELAPELAGAAAAREEQARADLARRASLSGFQEAIAVDVSALLFAEALAAKARERIQAAFEAQHEAAREAGSEPIERACLTAYIEHARYLSKAPAERDANAHASALRGIFRPVIATTRHLSDQDVIELSINATSSGALERSILRVERERAFAAGDAEELRRRKVEAEMAAEEEATRGMSLAQYEFRQSNKRHQAEQAEVAARASRKSGKRMEISIAEDF